MFTEVETWGILSAMDEPCEDPVVAAYMRDVDVSLLRENLKLTPGQRLEKFARQLRFAAAMREAGDKMREKKKEENGCGD